MQRLIAITDIKLKNIIHLPIHTIANAAAKINASVWYHLQSQTVHSINIPISNYQFAVEIIIGFITLPNAVGSLRY